MERLLRESGAREVKGTSEQEERMNLWKARKVFGGLLGQLSPERMSQDAVVPSSRISEVLSYIYAEADSAGIPCVSVVHAGDGNIHPNFLFDGNNREEVARVDGLSRKLMQKAVSCGGMITGEHGVGNDKLKYMPLVFPERETVFQMAVLKCFNPDHRLNPGKVFSGRSFYKNDRHNGKIQTRPVETKGHSSLRNGFEPFYDPENSVICVDASTTGKQLHARTKPDGLYFPLCLDESVALGNQMRLQPYTSCSFRYGPWADNVLGMNFRIGEKTVRVGSRTIKNAAGFELVRFLCHSGSRFGSVEQLVLRLRPVAERTQTWKLAGSFESLDTFRKAFLKSPWSNSADAFDFEMDGNGPGLFLTFSFSSGQEGAVDAQVMRFCDAFGLSASPAAEFPEYATKTAARVKAPLSQTLPAARELVRKHGGRACGYLGNGFFQFQPDPGSAVEEVTAGLQALHDRLAADGGHVDAGGLRYEKKEKELSWEQILKEEWSRLP
jgi:FAD/FMN-containing dehydrogenase